MRERGGVFAVKCCGDHEALLQGVTPSTSTDEFEFPSNGERIAQSFRHMSRRSE